MNNKLTRIIVALLLCFVVCIGVSACGAADDQELPNGIPNDADSAAQSAPTGYSEQPEADDAQNPTISSQTKPDEQAAASSGLPEEAEPSAAPAEPGATVPPLNPSADNAATDAKEPAANTALTCHLTVSCAILLDKADELDASKQALVPSDGMILDADFEFSEGDTVFDLLSRELKANGIHLEFSSNPAFNSVYIEGINNLYEFDCGDLSGWVYMVNGVSPGYGCNQYALADGDVVEWLYSCDLGRDVQSSAAAE